MKIKICGLFRIEDIDSINECMPDYAGFVFARSRRRVTIEMASHLRQRICDPIQIVGVFVNESISKIRNLYHDHIIDIAQLHGNESETYIRNLHDRTGMPVIRSVTVENASDILQYRRTEADYLLFDHGAGGTGLKFDWRLLNQVSEFPEMFPPCFLAGGLNEGNLSDAMSTNVFALDISSGVETHGFKDPLKMKRCVKMVRSMDFSHKNTMPSQ